MLNNNLRIILGSKSEKFKNIEALRKVKYFDKKSVLKNIITSDASQYPGLCFRSIKIVLEKSNGSKSESILHTLCHRNQVANVYAIKN